jgi:heterotetrameric sarcosine oxidase gamma subunit
MLDRRSALATAEPFSSTKLTIEEARAFSLIQAAGFSKDFESAIEAVTGALPQQNDLVVNSEGRAIFRTGPLQFWLVGPERDDLASQLAGKCVVTPLSHSRTRISVDGLAARDVLAKGLPIDLHESAFKPGMFAASGIHHTPVLLHCLERDAFHLYAMRTFAADIWDWLTDAAAEYAGR